MAHSVPTETASDNVASLHGEEFADVDHERSVVATAIEALLELLQGRRLLGWVFLSVAN